MGLVLNDRIEEIPTHEDLKCPDTPKEAADLLLKKWIDFGIDYRIEHNPDFAERYFADEEGYLARLELEYKVITDKDFSDYFLVVSDLLRWAKDVGIMIGPGRGSAAGSLLCYVLRITEIDPYPNPLMLFERFIDPSRPDMPDIDIDVADDKRHLVVERAVELYGRDYVCNIGNFSRYRGKTALETLARVYHVEPFEITKTKSLIVDRPDGDPRENNSLEDTVEAFSEAQELFEKYPDLRYGFALEGDYKNLGIHAAGLVISNDPIEDTVALYTREKDDGSVVTVVAYDKRDAERQGMLKLDLLGLSTMGIIGDVIDMVPELSITGFYAMTFDDEKTLEGFRHGDLTGIFQFDGRTTRGVAKRIYERTIGMEAGSPVRFDTLSDINALSRPGSLISGMTDKYIEVENGKVNPDKYHPVVDKILASSHGCLVFQEQVMKIGSELGGFPGSKVGALRKIIGKKTAGGAFEAYFQDFAKGAYDLHGMSEASARVIWDFMATSASYLFNVAHAWSYAVIAYWCMYLKVHYPAQFYAAALRRAERTAKRDVPLELMQDAVKHGIVVLPPTIKNPTRTWNPGFTMVDGRRVPCIQAGLLQIPNVGDSLTTAIQEFLEKNEVNSWDDLTYTAPKKGKRRVPCEPYTKTVQRTRKGVKVMVEEEFAYTTEEYIRTPATGVPKFGPKTTQNVKEFCTADDPFKIHLAEESCNIAINAIDQGLLPLTLPDTNASHCGSLDGIEVTYVGLIKEIRIIDVIEAERKRTGHSAEQVRREMKQPNKSTKAKIITTDATGAELHVNISRYVYPKYAEELSSATAKKDVIHVSGTAREGYGATIQADEIFVIDLGE